MKILRKIGMAIVAMMLCAGFVACSDDDEKNEIIDAIVKGDYLEVTINGKTYHGDVPSFYPELEVNYGLVCSQNVAVDNFKDFETNQLSFHYDDPDRLLKCKPGKYDVVRHELYNYADPEYKNFDFSLTYDGPNYDNFESMSGINKVTSIKRDKNGIVIEGKLDAEMSNAYFADRVDGVRTFRMTGKYRMTLPTDYYDYDM